MREKGNEKVNNTHLNILGNERNSHLHLQNMQRNLVVLLSYVSAFIYQAKECLSANQS